jgi:hypothetical protein
LKWSAIVLTNCWMAISHTNQAVAVSR